MGELTIEIAGIFLFLGLVYFVVGVILLLKLKKHVRPFYDKVKGKVLFATIVLSLSLEIRAVLNLVRSFTGLVDKTYYS